MLRRKRWLKAAYFSLILLVTVLVGFQLIINLSDAHEESQHADSVSAITQALQGKDTFEFAVVGEVKNSMRVFRDQILRSIEDSDAEFFVSAGNFVSSGSAEGYRAATRILSESRLPFLLTYGKNEDSEFGSFRYYERFGPHFFSFTVANTHFIFLDITGKTPAQWQLGWLERELGVAADHVFVFAGSPLQPGVAEDHLFETEPMGDMEFDSEFRDRLVELLTRHQPDAIFSAGSSVFDQQEVNGVEYVITGGAGGLIVDDEDSYHHFVRVTVDSGEVTITPEAMDIAHTPWLSTLDSVWSALYTLFYVSYPRFLLWVGVLTLIALKLRETLFTERNYYRRFEIDPARLLKSPERVAFFSNNFFPFVSGVTLSIERLRTGLSAQGTQVCLFVPNYGRKKAGKHNDEHVFRVRSLWSFGKKREFKLANLFSLRVVLRLRAFRPDIIHVHHPFWLGSLGLFLGRRMNIPVVYTYHTRLEQYAHYVPLPSQVFRNFISHWLVKHFCNKCSGVVVPTVSVEDYLRAIGVRTPTLVQPTGIDHEQFSHADEGAISELAERWHVEADETVLITVSRLGREKNIDFLLDGIHELRKMTRKSFRLLIVGQGDEHDRLAERIRSEDLSQAVTLTGPIEPEAMANAYHLADIFVFASKSETQGMVLLEAMSAGLPVVAVRSSGIDDVIQPGVTGYKTRESTRDWASRVAELIEDKGVRHRMADASTELAKQHDIGQFAMNINNFYAEILALHESD